MYRAFYKHGFANLQRAASETWGIVRFLKVFLVVFGSSLKFSVATYSCSGIVVGTFWLQPSPVLQIDAGDGGQWCERLTLNEILSPGRFL